MEVKEPDDKTKALIFFLAFETIPIMQRNLAKNRRIESMSKSKNVRKDLSRIITGMVYHCSDLSELMKDNFNDPFFDGPTGELVKRNAAELLKGHVMLMMTLPLMDDKHPEDTEEKGEETKDVENLTMEDELFRQIIAEAGEHNEEEP